MCVESRSMTPTRGWAHFIQLGCFCVSYPIPKSKEKINLCQFKRIWDNQRPCTLSRNIGFLYFWGVAVTKNTLFHTSFNYNTWKMK